ncbi:hypothetical protein IFM89_003886 [Coptis chinensis]|uniref:DUF4283 domain-containing protein n=1 Tax=Coptis chinensis TaxID=261450 RepID=A0A835HYD5_9MAGN|nr:hypothetical protein IFM89_003886 [Coptis chinensis]
MFRFDKAEDFQKIWDQGSWIFDKQVLRLVKWTPNFFTEKEIQSFVVVWVRFPGLSLEYWEIRNLLVLGRALGKLIHVDETTAKCELGYYASVYVDLDLSKPVPDKIWVESKKHGVGFWQMVKLGKTPEFCNHCKGVGHSVVRCKLLKSDMEKGKEKEKEKVAAKEKTVVILSTPVEELVNDDLIGEKYGMNRSQKKRWRKKNRDEATTSGAKIDGQVVPEHAEHQTNLDVEVEELVENDITVVNILSPDEANLFIEVFGETGTEDGEEQVFVDAEEPSNPPVMEVVQPIYH